jgi:ATP-dependent Lon protease
MAEAFEDEDEEADQEIYEKVSQLYGEALHLTSGWAHPESIRRATPTPEALSFLVAAHLGMELDDKQAILEMRSVNARLLRLAHILEQSLSGLREMKRRIGGNGHLA